MRVWWVLLLLVPSTVAWSDASGDQEIGYLVVEAQGEEHMVWQDAEPLGMYPNADLTSLEITETRDDLVFTATFAGAGYAGTEPSEFFSIRTILEFRLHGQDMVALLEWYQDDDIRDYSYMVIGTPDPEDSFWGISATSFATATIDDATATVVFPKAHFRTPDYNPVREGDVFEDVRVHVSHMEFSTGLFGFFPVVSDCRRISTDYGYRGYSGCAWRVHDDIDGGAVLGDVTVELAPEGVGHLLVRADRPFRLSNGLATTYLFNITLYNFDPEADDVALQAVQVPKGWDVLHPASVHFDGQGSKSVPVAVTVPFVHQHGTTASLQLQALSSRDTDVEAGMELGVVFVDPPQPAGHHDTLHLHAGSRGFGSTWMNTWEDDPDADLASAGPNYWSNGLVPPQTTFGWTIRLNPALGTGLDFDLSKQADVRVVFSSDLDRDVVVRAMLTLRGETVTELSSMVEQTASLPGGGATEFTFSLPLLPIADRIEPFEGNLALQLEMDTDAPQFLGFSLTGDGDPVELVTDGSLLRLPLLDYHDEVDLGDLTLNAFTVEGETTLKHVNPGRTAAFVFNVTNRLSATQTLSWGLSGDHADWATVEPAKTVVPGGGVGQVVVRVRVPEDATLDDAAELLLRGTVEGDETQQVFVRMSTLVTTDEDVPDEESLAMQAAADVQDQNERLGKDSPLAAWLVFAALGAAFVARRRD